MAGIIPGIPIPNHQKLLNECYPSSKDLASADPLPKPDSNNLSKLCFYASKPPPSTHKRKVKSTGSIQSKLPKVAKALQKRAEKDAAGSYTLGNGPNGASNAKRGGMLVTLSVLKKLIEECGGIDDEEKGRAGGGEKARLHLAVLSEPAEKIIEMGIQRSAPMHPGGERDFEMAARAAGAFHALATFSHPSLIGQDDGLTQGYISCLVQMCGLAKEGIVGSWEGIAGTRMAGLHALSGAVTSEVMYSSTEFANQVKHVVPALLFNLIDPEIDMSTLRLESSKSDEDVKFAEHHSIRRPSALRRAQSLHASSEAPKTSDTIASACLSLRSLFRLSNGGQIRSLLEPLTDWLDHYKGGEIWRNTEWCCWLVGTLIGWTHLQYRFIVFGFFLDRLTGELGDYPVQRAANGSSGWMPKQTTLLKVLDTILRGRTNLSGLAIGDILGHLLQLIIRRARLGPKDPLMGLIVDCVSALGTKVYYADQVNDVASDIIGCVIGLQIGEGEGAGAGVEAGEVGVGNANLRRSARDEASKVMLACLGGVMDEAKKNGGEITAAVPVKVQNGQEQKKDDAEGEIEKDSIGRPLMKEARVGIRNKISPEVWQESLALLVESSDPSVRLAYSQTLVKFIKNELSEDGTVTSSTGTGSLASKAEATEQLARFLNGYHASIYEVLVSRSLGSGAMDSSRASSRAPSNRKKSSARNGSSNVSMNSASRKASLIPNEEEDSTLESSLASPAEYTAIRDSVVALQSKQSIGALLSGIPMLLALDKDAGVKWASTPGENRFLEAERRRACREISASGFEAIAMSWGVDSVEKAAQEASKYLSPSILPNLPSFDRLSSSSSLPRFALATTGGGSEASVSAFPVLDKATMVDGIAGNGKVQQAAGMDRNSLRNALGQEWTAEAATRKAFVQEAILAADSRSSPVKQRGSLVPSLSVRSPSIADLRASLGNSVAPSTSSQKSEGLREGVTLTDQGPQAKKEELRKRKSVRVPAAELLASIGIASTNGDAGDKPQGNQLSVFNAPYAVS